LEWYRREAGARADPLPPAALRFACSEGQIGTALAWLRHHRLIG
jgi:hypothetical protein